MQPDQPAIPEITDDDVVASRARVRALLVSRLEAKYQVVSRAIRDAETMGIPPDPRLLEIGIRIDKEMSLLYGLQKPAPVSADDEPKDQLGNGIEKRDAVLLELTRLEERIRSVPDP